MPAEFFRAAANRPRLKAVLDAAWRCQLRRDTPDRIVTRNLRSDLLNGGFQADVPNTPSLSRIADQAKLEAEIAQRIRVDSGYFGGQLPSASTIAWAGYVAALTEWGLIGVASHLV